MGSELQNKNLKCLVVEIGHRVDGRLVGCQERLDAINDVVLSRIELRPMAGPQQGQSGQMPW